ncbi:D-serine deaminase-like pyridoxal phosphate-dependent protein [Bradyrhizobium sp. GM5.1]
MKNATTTVPAIDTPALLVDLDLMEANTARIAERCRGGGVAWRPHCKSHKSPDIAKRLVAAGAIGVTCSKLSEAEAMAAAGVPGIMIANQIVGLIKIDRLMALSRRAEVIVAVDCVENVSALAEAAAQAGLRLPVVIEVDVGMGRAGTAPGDATVALARLVAGHASLRLAGLMAWEGHTVRIPDPDKKARAVTDAVALLTGSAEACRTAGLSIEIVSCGGTGTFAVSAGLAGVTEIQAGGGIFGDVHYRELYHVPVDYALTVLTTVTSRPSPQRIITDAGKKAMSSDSGMPVPLGLPPVAALGFSAEHGKIELVAPSETPRVADRLRLVVGYSDTTVHLHDTIYGVRGDTVEQVWPIPRGARLR